MKRVYTERYFTTDIYFLDVSMIEQVFQQDDVKKLE